MQFLRHPLTILSFALLGLLFSLSLYSSWQRNKATSSQVAALETEVEKITQEVQDLSDVAAVASSAGTQEKIIRDQLLMQKEGEIIVQLPEIDLSQVKKIAPSPSPTPWEEWQKVLF